MQSILTNVAWLNDGTAAKCGREIQINILVHTINKINAPPTSSPRPARLLIVGLVSRCYLHFLVQKFNVFFGMIVVNGNIKHLR